jgi:hypothetical protein
MGTMGALGALTTSIFIYLKKIYAHTYNFVFHYSLIHANTYNIELY